MSYWLGFYTRAFSFVAVAKITSAIVKGWCLFMENTNEKVIDMLLKTLRMVCEENGLNYIFAIEAKNKPDSALWYSVPTDTDLEEAKQMIADYLYR